VLWAVVVTSASFIDGGGTEVKERTAELVFKLLALLDANAILRTELWNLLHRENIRYCFSVYPVVDTSDDVE
jgi:transglutaminase-like putative cysteine protease